MNTEIAKRDAASALENVITKGDLKDLSPVERVQYYKAVCESTGLNPLTKPFDYITLNGKVTLYALKAATDQLRKVHNVSIEAPKVEYADDLVVVTVVARTGDRTDSDTGAVSLAGLKGEAKANAIMKAITKAKRRVTLSICGLGWLDETEVETIPTAKRIEVDTDSGEIREEKPAAAPPPPKPKDEAAVLRDTFADIWKAQGRPTSKSAREAWLEEKGFPTFPELSVPSLRQAIEILENEAEPEVSE